MQKYHAQNITIVECKTQHPNPNDHLLNPFHYSAPKAVQKFPVPRSKNKNREDQRFGDPPMNKSKHLWVLYFDRESFHTNVRPGYT